MRTRLSAFSLPALTLTACLAFAGAAHAQNALDRADARCILVLSVVKDPKAADAAAQGTFYFLGRLIAHGIGGARLEGLLDSEAKTLPSDRFQPELSRCSKELTASSNDLQGAYRNLRAKDAAAQRAIIRPVGK